MKIDDLKSVNVDKYDIATEVLSSAICILRAVGFSEREIPNLFEQVSKNPVRRPLWIEPSAANAATTGRGR